MDWGTVWPAMRERISGATNVGPPFTSALADAQNVFLACAAPTEGFFDFLQEHAPVSLGNAHWQILLGVDPAQGTDGLRAGLESLLTQQEKGGPTFQVRLLTPGLLAGAPPRFELALLRGAAEGSWVSVGSSPAFGLGVPGAGDLNVWMRLDAEVANGLREFAKALWSIGVPLSRALCDVPDLVPARGNEEGLIHWRAYEALVHGSTDLSQSGQRTIADLPVTSGGLLDEAVLDVEAESEGEALVNISLDDTAPKVPALYSQIESLFRSGSLMAVSQQARPLAVPVPPSLFGQNSGLQIGAVRQKQSFTIDLFAEPVTVRAIEKLRTGAGELLKLFSYSFGHGRYWVPDRARSELDGAIDRLRERAEKEFGVALGADLESFLQRRRTAVGADLTAFFTRLFPGETMPAGKVDEVLALLKERVEAVRGSGFIPRMSSSRVSFEWREGGNTSLYADALTLVTQIARRPREILASSFEQRAVKPSGISIPAFLKAMDVLGDALLRSLTEDNWSKASVARSAESDLALIDRWAKEEAAEDTQLRRLYDLIAGGVAG